MNESNNTVGYVSFSSSTNLAISRSTIKAMGAFRKNDLRLL